MFYAFYVFVTRGAMRCRCWSRSVWGARVTDAITLSVPDLDEIFHRWAASSEALCFLAWKASSYWWQGKPCESSFQQWRENDVRALDHTVWCLQAITRFCINGGYMYFCLSDGSRLKGEVHQSWQSLDPCLFDCCIWLGGCPQTICATSSWVQLCGGHFVKSGNKTAGFFSDEDIAFWKYTQHLAF